MSSPSHCVWIMQKQYEWTHCILPKYSMFKRLIHPPNRWWFKITALPVSRDHVLRPFTWLCITHTHIHSKYTYHKHHLYAHHTPHTPHTTHMHTPCHIYAPHIPHNTPHMYTHTTHAPHRETYVPHTGYMVWKQDAPHFGSWLIGYFPLYSSRNSEGLFQLDSQRRWWFVWYEWWPDPKPITVAKGQTLWLARAGPVPHKIHSCSRMIIEWLRGTSSQKVTLNISFFPYFHINCVILIGFQELTSVSSSIRIFSKEKWPSFFIYQKKDHIMEENVSGIMGSSTLSFLFEDASLSKIF